jgi:hypothetical protein
LRTGCLVAGGAGPALKAPDRALSQLAWWFASQPEGNRNAGLFWDANRVLDANLAADLSPLAVAGRQAGLSAVDREAGQ